MRHHLRIFYFVIIGCCLIISSCKKKHSVADTKKPDDNRFTPVTLTLPGRPGRADEL